MLALKSIMTTTVNGCTLLSKNVISCGLSLSRIVKSSRSSPGTNRPLASMTVASTDTIRVPDRNVGFLPGNDAGRQENNRQNQG